MCALANSIVSVSGSLFEGNRAPFKGEDIGFPGCPTEVQSGSVTKGDPHSFRDSFIERERERLRLRLRMILKLVIEIE